MAGNRAVSVVLGLRGLSGKWRVAACAELARIGVTDLTLRGSTPSLAAIQMAPRRLLPTRDSLVASGPR